MRGRRRSSRREIALVFLAILGMEISIGSPSESWAAETVTQERVIESADRHFPVLQAMRYDLEASRQELRAAQGGFDPVARSSAYATPNAQYEYWNIDNEIEQPTGLWGARFFAGYRKSGGVIPGYDGHLVTDPRGEARIGVGIPLLRGGVTDERRTRISVATEEVGAQTAATNLERVESVRMARLRYIEWVTAGLKLRVARNLLQLAADRDVLLRKRVARGDAAEIEGVDNARTVAHRESLMVASRRSFEATSLELSLYLRDAEGNPEIAREAQLPPEGLRTDVRSNVGPAAGKGDAFLGLHPIARRWDALIGQNTSELRLARNLVLPRLDFEALASRDLGPPPSPRFGDELRVALRLEFPILFRTALGRLEAVELKRSRMMEMRQFALERIWNGVLDADEAMRAARERIDIAKNELALSVRVEVAERKRFQSGDSNIFLVNQREQTTFDSALREIDARADLNRAYAFLIASRGVVTESDYQSSSSGIEPKGP